MRRKNIPVLLTEHRLHRGVAESPSLVIFKGGMCLNSLWVLMGTRDPAAKHVSSVSASPKINFTSSSIACHRKMPQDLSSLKKGGKAPRSNKADKCSP